VNIITKEPLRNSFSIANTTGIYGKGLTEINTAINGSFVTDDYKTGAYVFAVANNRDPYDRDGDGFMEVPKLRSETLGFRAYHKPSDYSKLTLEYHRIHEFRRGGNRLDRPPHEADIAEQLNHQINGGGLKYDLFSKDYKHRLNIYTSMQGINRESYFGTEQDLNAYGHTKDFTFLAGSQYTLSMDHFWFMPADFTAGIEYFDNNLDDRMPAHNRHIKQRATSFGGYAQNEWKDERFSLVLGARLDKHNLMKNAVFSPRANTRFMLNENLTFRASYAYGYRAPQIYDEDLHIAAVGGNAVLIVINDDLKPEYANSLNFSVDLNKNFGKMAANLLIDAFYTNLENVFVLEEKGHDENDNLILERTNASGAIVQGLNFDFNFGLTSKILANIGFTVQRSRYKEPFEWSSEVEPQKRMLRSPDQYGYITLNYTPNKKLTISATGNYTGSMLAPHFSGYIEHDREVKTPSFFDAGMRIAYEFQLSKLLKLETSIGMKNIFDQFQKDLDKGPLRDSGFIYGPTMPRMLYFGLKFFM
jgi:outer membrane receptor for ferrienterochelin and colicins